MFGTMVRLPVPPDPLLGHSFHLPVEQKKVHSREPASLAVHRMLGFGDQAPGRTVTFVRDSAYKHPVAMVQGADRRVTFIDDPGAVLAAFSYLEGERLKDSLKAYPMLAQSMKVETDLRLANTWHGVGMIPVSKDGSEFAFIRKDELHPVPGYCLRLGMVGGGMDAHEVLLWSAMEERATVAITREVFEEITNVEIASEMVARMTFAGSHETRCYLYMKDGMPTTGFLHLFIAQAESPEQWRRWRHLFTKEGDGLGEARPELMSQTTLIQALKEEKAAAEARATYLRLHDDDSPRVLVGAEEGTPYQRTREQSPAEWRRLRDEAHARGVFPLRERGNFSFIAGHGVVLSGALPKAGIVLT